MSDPSKVIVFPNWRDNPYPNVVALATAATGREITGCTQLSSLVGLLAKAGAGDILHMHWTVPIVQRAEDEADARDRLDTFVRAVNAFKKGGGRVVWTIHNAVPHELRFGNVERELMVKLEDLANVIHVMNPDTAAEIADDVVLSPEKVQVVPHPSYNGFYPDSMTRDEARESFGLEPHERAVVFVGQLRAYKGVGTLLEALNALPEDVAGRTALLLAGKVRDDEDEVLRAALPQGMKVIFEPGFVDDGDLARWYRAGDVAVLPYQRILNSGSAHLAATFGLPLVLPNESHIVAEYGDEPWVHFFDRDDAVASIAALLADDSTYVTDTAAVEEFCRARSPWRVSEQMRDRVYLGA